MAFPSTFLDLQNAVLAKGRLDATADRGKVKDWLNQVQLDVVLQTEALISIATMTPPANSPSETLSAVALRVKAIFSSYGGQQYRPMEPVSLQRMLEFRQGSGTVGDTSRYYTFLGQSEIEFWPTPMGTETFTIYYVAAPSLMVDDTDTPDIVEPFASRVLEYGALIEAADFKRDDSVDRYEKKYLEWLGKFRSHLNRKRSGVPEQMLVYGSPSFPPHDPSTDVRW